MGCKKKGKRGKVEGDEKSIYRSPPVCMEIGGNAAVNKIANKLFLEMVFEEFKKRSVFFK